jgi:Rha family phage regulatory protein
MDNVNSVTIALVLKSQDGTRDITTSLIISEVFYKRHADVLRDIENLSCSDEFRQRNFALSSYSSKQGKDLPMYEITKDGFGFLVMGYTGDKAGQFKELFIAEFNRRDALLKNPDYIISQAFMLLEGRKRDLENQLESKTKQLAIANEVIMEAAPKVEYHDEVLQAKDTITTTVIAKDLGMSAIALNDLLHKHGVIFKVQGTWVLYQKYAARGYTKSKTYPYYDSNEVLRTKIDTYWTEEGRKFIMEGVKKIREQGKL